MVKEIKVEQRDFDYEQSLWDNVVLMLVKETGYMNAIAAANAAVKARRDTFNDKQEGEA